MTPHDPVIPAGDHKFEPSTEVGPGKKFTECNEVYFRHGDNYAIVILLPIPGVREGALYKLFCKRSTRSESNFTHLEDAACLTINGNPVLRLECGEQLFKLYCVLSHISNDPVDADASVIGNRLAVMQKVLVAPAPVHAKKATNDLTPFDSEGWNKVSFEAMVATQKWKATSTKIHAEMQYLASLAVQHGLPLRNIFYVECADPDPKVPRDLNWGCGLTIEELIGSILFHPDSPWGDANVTDKIHKDCPYSGANGLGRALQIALRFVLGDNGEFLHESVEEYRARFGTEMPLVSYTPVATPAEPNSDLLRVEPIHLLRSNSDLIRVEPNLGLLPVETEDDDDDVVFVREERSPTEIKRTRSTADNDTSSARAPSLVEEMPECARTLSVEDGADEPVCARTLSLYP
jgi:hypothetical protein